MNEWTNERMNEWINEWMKNDWLNDWIIEWTYKRNENWMNELTNEPTHEQKFLLAVKSKGLYYHGSRKGKWSSDNKPAARILHGRGGGVGGEEIITLEW